jgi:hypothetical protein
MHYDHWSQRFTRKLPVYEVYELRRFDAFADGCATGSLRSAGSSEPAVIGTSMAEFRPRKTRRTGRPPNQSLDIFNPQVEY